MSRFLPTLVAGLALLALGCRTTTDTQDTDTDPVVDACEYVTPECPAPDGLPYVLRDVSRTLCLTSRVSRPVSCEKKLLDSVKLHMLQK